MKRALLAGAAILGVLASSTLAQAAGGAYARIEVGAVQTPKLQVGPTGRSTDPGFSFGGAFGWQLDGGLTVEVEAVYMESRIQNPDIDLSAFSVMGNVLIDVMKWEKVSLFAGVGIGADQVTLHANEWPGFVPPLHSDSEFVFAGQAIIGLNASLGDVETQFRYKFNAAFDDASLDVRTAPPVVWETEWAVHSLSFSVLFDL